MPAAAAVALGTLSGLVGTAVVGRGLARRSTGTVPAGTLSNEALPDATPPNATPRSWTRTNFRGREVTLAGAGAALAAAAGGAVVAVLDEPGGGRRAGLAVLLVALVAGGLGLHDDLRGDEGTKGLRGHLASLARGRVTSGSAKLVGIALAGLAAAVVLGARSAYDVVTVGGVIAGCANLANLLDLRPGRALKVLLVAASLLAVGADTGVAALGWWSAGVALGAMPLDLRERTMLGDAGANALGAVVGVVAGARTGGGMPAGATLLALVALTLASERVSFSRVIDRVAPLRWADRLGRTA